MTAPAAVLGLVLATTAVGSVWLLWLAPTFGQLRRGYEVLVAGTAALLGWGALASLGAPLDGLEAATDLAAAGRVRTALGVFIAATVLAAVARFARGPSWLVRVLGLTGALAGVASFWPLAAIRAERGGPGGTIQGLGELLLGAGLLGAIWVGLLLGHWYLVERRLSNRYMVWISWANVGAVVAGLGSVLLSARNPVPCEGLPSGEFERCARMFSPVLRIDTMSIVLGMGVLALVALIAAFNVRLAREGGRSIQASTGMFYLAVILAPAVEFAAKVRFF